MLVDRFAPSSLELERLLADVFRRAHWRVRLRPLGGGLRPDMIVEGGGKRFLIEMKRSSEGRGDRLIPLLSQAILQAQAVVRQFPEPVVPLAVVAAERVPQSVAEQVKQFAAQFAPDTGVGIIDSHGLRAFAGHGLEVLDARPSRPVRSGLASPQRLPHLFSDLNQWLLKILLGQSIPQSLLSVPRAEFRNATQLAAAAQVSVMSASRFVRQLAREALLDDRGGHLEIVRVEHLLGRWAAANQQALREIPVRWVIRKEPHQLLAAVKSYASEADAASLSRSKPRFGRIARVSATLRDRAVCCSRRARAWFRPRCPAAHLPGAAGSRCAPAARAVTRRRRSPRRRLHTPARQSRGGFPGCGEARGLAGLGRSTGVAGRFWPSRARTRPSGRDSETRSRIAVREKVI